MNRYLDRKLIDTRSPWLPSICLRSACVALKLTFCTRNESSIFANLTISCVLAHEQARMDSARSFHIITRWLWHVSCNVVTKCKKRLHAGDHGFLKWNHWNGREQAKISNKVDDWLKKKPRPTRLALANCFEHLEGMLTFLFEVMVEIVIPSSSIIESSRTDNTCNNVVDWI